jgi:hypothetical protein
MLGHGHEGHRPSLHHGACPLSTGRPVIDGGPRRPKFWMQCAASVGDSTSDCVAERSCSEQPGVRPSPTGKVPRR